MDTVDRFSVSSSSASSINDSPRPSHSTRPSFADVRSQSRNTSDSSTMEPNGRTSPDHPPGVTDETESGCFEDSELCLAQEHEHLDTLESACAEALPTQEQMDAAADITIFDAEGNPRPFRHLYQGSEHQGQRQMIIFVRHFYCSLCQCYIKALIDTVTPARYFSLPVSTTITIIGCGRPHLLHRYLERTTCPFRMYVDPSRRLYKALGMVMTPVLGKKMEYNSDNNVRILKDSFGQLIKDGLKDPKDAFSGGNMIQVGGEFLFQGGQCIWCHRMRTTRGHIETRILNKILESSEEELKNARSSNDTPAELSSKTKSARASSGPQKSKPSNANGGMKLVWENTAADATPRARLQKKGPL